MNNLFIKSITVGLLSLFGGLAGCSSIVKSTINTQPIVAIQEKEFLHPDTIVKGQATFYVPQKNQLKNALDPDLYQFSPVLVQGFQRGGPKGKKHKYDYWQDGIGAPYLVDNGQEVRINTDLPMMYSRVEQAQVYGQKLKQLVYVWWYPSRPVGSIEKGEVDGNILRITLDRNHQPIVFEYSQTCGCYHGVFASQDLEQLAKDQFQQPLPGKRFAVEKKQPEKADWVIRDLIHVNPDQRLFVYVSAGKHFGEALRFMDMASIDSHSQRNYTLAPYESLVHIPTGQGTASMFNEDGLVKGAKRSGEEFMMGDLDHPGWPRHLDRMLIHWDQDRWSDPKLLEETLRIPHQAVTNTPTAQNKDASTADSQSMGYMEKSWTSSKKLYEPGNGQTGARIIEQTPSNERNGMHDLPDEILDSYPHDKPFVVLVSHKYCIGCQAFKKEVLPQPDVQQQLKNYHFISLDMYIKEQMVTAQSMNITVTPTVIYYDKEGHELRRIEGVDSKAQLIQFIGG